VASIAHRSRLTGWLWVAAAYLLVVVVVFALAKYFGSPTPTDLGWSD
jgi:bacteriorhodopsin